IVIVIIVGVLAVLALGLPSADTWTTCGFTPRSCNPGLGNLVTGRDLRTSSTCGLDSSQLLCSYSDNQELSCQQPSCHKCNSDTHSHPPSAMADSPFRYPRTWWQSAQSSHRETIQLDLETHFYFTHLILIFKSPRPAAMVLERSQDFGESWTPYKYFATNCSHTFGLHDDMRVSGAICTSRYSAPLPCTRGEVSQSLGDCPCLSKNPALKPQHFAHYAIYDFIVKGSCFCNGHADQCVPTADFRPQVHGKCICRHNTEGEHCDRCSPLYNDQPWQAADGKSGAPRECQKCLCNDHAESCHFDLGVWLASGNHSGGVCDDCKHNTEGQHCHRCQPGFYRDLRSHVSAPDVCKPCSCHAVGSSSFLVRRSPWCEPSHGDCVCKPGVAGPYCDQCMVGYWGFGQYGCRPCACAGSCDPFTGDCINRGFHEGSFSGVIIIIKTYVNYSFSGKCECRDQVLGNPKVFCNMKYTYVLKVRILSAHDRGSHAEVNVKIKKVLKLTKLKIRRGKRVLFPESWTNRGCTCPVLNPAMEYLVAGHEDVRSGRLVVNMKSFVQPWKADLGRRVIHILKTDCQ
uniref:Netrin-1 n=1 Tax=Callorhinchus milii TaxID=7868 RepID=A0A4W3J836_CALMI